jgi:hypothetical protein
MFSKGYYIQRLFFRPQSFTNNNDFGDSYLLRSFISACIEDLECFGIIRHDICNMSDLQRAFAKAKLSTYPANPPIPFEEAEEGEEEEEEEEEKEETDGFAELPVDDDSSSASSASSASSTGTIIPSSNQNLFARPQG